MKLKLSLGLLLPALAFAQAEAPAAWRPAAEDPVALQLAVAAHTPAGDAPADLSPGVIRAAARVQTRPGDLPRLRIAVDGKKLDLPLRHTHV